MNVNDPSATLYLFSARTEPTGIIAPGSGLPAVNATLNPASVQIIERTPIWAQLGASSGTCWGAGCGLTGWIQSDYQVRTAGTYQLVLGVSNFVDTAYDSGLAFSGIQIGNSTDGYTPIEDSAAPEPAAWALMLLGVGGMGAALRTRLRDPNSAKSGEL